MYDTKVMIEEGWKVQKKNKLDHNARLVISLAAGGIFTRLCVSVRVIVKFTSQSLTAKSTDV